MFISPLKIRARRFDRVLVRFFFVVEVANARTVVDAGGTLYFTGKVQEGVGKSGFSGPAVTA